jgi:hypothetical protein
MTATQPESEHSTPTRALPEIKKHSFVSQSTSAATISTLAETSTDSSKGHEYILEDLMNSSEISYSDCTSGPSFGTESRQEIEDYEEDDGFNLLAMMCFSNELEEDIPELVVPSPRLADAYVAPAKLVKRKQSDPPGQYMGASDAKSPKDSKEQEKNEGINADPPFSILIDFDIPHAPHAPISILSSQSTGVSLSETSLMDEPAHLVMDNASVQYEHDCYLPGTKKQTKPIKTSALGALFCFAPDMKIYDRDDSKPSALFSCHQGAMQAPALLSCQDASGYPPTSEPNTADDKEAKDTYKNTRVIGKEQVLVKVAKEVNEIHLRHRVVEETVPATKVVAPQQLEPTTCTELRVFSKAFDFEVPEAARLSMEEVGGATYDVGMLTTVAPQQLEPTTCTELRVFSNAFDFEAPEAARLSMEEEEEGGATYDVGMFSGKDYDTESSFACVEYNLEEEMEQFFHTSESNDSELALSGSFFDANPISSTKDRAQGGTDILFGTGERAPPPASQPSWAPCDKGGISPPMSINQKYSSARDQNAFRRIDQEASGLKGNALSEKLITKAFVHTSPREKNEVTPCIPPLPPSEQSSIKKNAVPSENTIPNRAANRRTDRLKQAKHVRAAGKAAMNSNKKFAAVEGTNLDKPKNTKPTTKKAEVTGNAAMNSNKKCAAVEGTNLDKPKNAKPTTKKAEVTVQRAASADNAKPKTKKAEVTVKRAASADDSCRCTTVIKAETTEVATSVFSPTTAPLSRRNDRIRILQMSRKVRKQRDVVIA